MGRRMFVCPHFHCEPSHSADSWQNTRCEIQLFRRERLLISPKIISYPVAQGANEVVLNRHLNTGHVARSSGVIRICAAPHLN